MIEHRWNERIKTDHKVLLITNNNDKIDGSLSNISLYGGYVETAEPLSKGTGLHIRFVLPEQAPPTLCELSALVVHQSEQGVGLIINPSQTEAIECVQELLQYYRARRQSQRLQAKLLATPALSAQLDKMPNHTRF